MGNRLPRRMRRRLARGLGETSGTCVVVAVSGGSDSVALLRLAHAVAPELGLRLIVAHLDHGARGAASAADAGFVAALAKDLGLPCEIGHWAPSRPNHFEADARRARYDWLRELALRHGARAIVVGHTRDDQAETILHRIVRGTGLRGLSGMPARRSLAPGLVLIRPLLGVTRAELRDYLATRDQPFREDGTNADLARTRARLRHDLLPRLAQDYNPRIIESLVRLGRLARAADRAARARAETQLAALALNIEPSRIDLDRPALAALVDDERAEVLRRAWQRAGWPELGMGWKRWRRLAALADQPRARASIGHGVEASATKRRLTLERRGVGGPTAS